MGLPTLGHLRRARLFLKATAVVVTVAFLGLTLQPLALAARLPSAAAASAKTPPTSEEMLSRALEDIENQLAQLESKLDRRLDATTEKAKLKTMRQELDALDKQARANFDAIERHLKDKKLPQVILDRHTEAVRTYRSEMAVLKSNLDSLEIAKDDTERKARAQKAREHFKTKQKKKTHTPVDPNNLPFRVPDAKKTRKPAEKKEDFEKLGLLQDERIQLASTELLPGMLLPVALLAAPGQADLAPTEDVQITPEIQSLATLLGNNPVKIYNWVQNNIFFVPSYGSIQGSQFCMETKRCNAFDTASLLIALLRASGIHARYVYGTVEIPTNKVMNWVGGVNKAEAAQELLGQGGIPNAAVIQGGRVTKFRMEHVWVEAWVDFYPSRGAIHRQGDSWVPMDASFKQYQFTQGMNIQNSVPFDSQALVEQVQATATVNQTQGWVQGVNSNLVIDAVSNYQIQLQNHVESTKPNATVGDVLGTQSIVVSNRTVLAASTPYHVLATAARYAALPATVRHRVQFSVYASALERALDEPSLSFSQSLPSLAGKKLTLSYEGETAADQSVIDNTVASGATSLPAYLIRVKPVLKVESAVMASGNGITMGERQTFTVTVSTPWYSRPGEYKLTAGDFNALVLNPGGITSEVFTKRMAAFDLTDEENPGPVDEMFYQIGLGWWLEKFAFNNVIGRSIDVRNYQLPSHGLAGTTLSVRYFFGIPRSASYMGRSLDVKEDLVMAAHMDGENEPRRQFMLKSGQMGSYLEGGIFEQAFFAGREHGVSSISLLGQAMQQNIPVYVLTSENINAALPQLALTADIESEIANAVAAGKKVTTAQRDVNYFGYTGVGYIIEDPVTGSAAYQIDGGRSGGGAPVDESAQPLAAATPGVLLMGALASAAEASAPLTGMLARLAGFAISPAGLVLIAIVVVIAIAFIVAQAVILSEEFREEVIAKAATNPLAKDLPGDNCRVVAAQIKIAPPGWIRCTYTCRSSGNFHPRYLPVEVLCPQPLPCAPGLPDPPAPRLPLTPFDPSVAECVFR